MGSFLEQVLINLADGITVQDTDFNIIYQNAAMQLIFGNHIGKKCYEVYEKRCEICEGCGLQQAFLTGKPVVVLRTAFESDGQTAFYENSCFPVFDESGRIIAGAEVCRNVSDRVSLEAEVKERNIELGQLTTKLKVQALNLRQEMETRLRLEMELREAQKLQAVGQLAAGIAHEINTPAQFVNDNLQYLSEAFSDLLTLTSDYRDVVTNNAFSSDNEQLQHRLAQAEEKADLAFARENIREAFSAAREGIARIAKIVSAMKEFAATDKKTKGLTDINRMIETTLVVAHNEYRNIAEVETELGELPPVYCHAGEIKQVLLSLIINAAHAVAEKVGESGDKGRIKLKTKSEGDTVRIVISDTGCGIPPENRDRLFEPFFTTKPVGRGSGQGLAIARTTIVNKHQGSLTFDSRSGEGTTFTIVLPIGNTG